MASVDHLVYAAPDLDAAVDRGTAPHPSATAPGGVTLVELHARHPDPPRVEAMLCALGLDLPVAPGPEPALVAVLDTPRGRVELR